MKIILLCGNKSNQYALAAKVANNFDLVGIVLEQKKAKQPRNLFYIIPKIINRLFFFKISTSWNEMLSYYAKNYLLPKKPNKLITDNINSKVVADFIMTLQPDLIMVSGTSLIKKDILDLRIPKGIINLHTGLSPYVKGGPNCTNWCISNNTLHLIGNTVMWIDKGIDSGNIITSETVRFNGDETLNEIHIKVMEHAHHLYLKVLYTLLSDFENCPSIKQTDIGKGQLFLTRMWNMKAKFKFMLHLVHLNKRIQEPNMNKKIQQLRLVKLPPVFVVDKRIH